jgi:hypothetical protein
MRLPGFTAEGSLYRTQGYKTVETHRNGIGRHLARPQMVLGGPLNVPPPGGPPTSSICNVFPWLCGGGPTPDPCVVCATLHTPSSCCTCGGGTWQLNARGPGGTCI